MSTYLEASRLTYPLPSEHWQALHHPYRQEKTTVRIWDKPDEEPMHKWPWRGCAFASDLGSISYLVGKPQLGLLGWMMAIPYYGYAIFTQPRGKKRNEEIVYQSTANGLFPLVEAKLGILTGKHFANWLLKICPNSLFTKFPKLFYNSPGVYNITGGILALAILTPTVGDPLSRSIRSQYHQVMQERE